MSFGLKNAPAIFQRKIDNCFKDCEEFLVVYIDDILVFSSSEETHVQHLTRMLDICAKEGLVLSPNKMKIAQPEIEFLGATIVNRKIKLQQHIVKKIFDFDEQKLQTLKGLRSWLGVLNYARPYIKNLSTLLGPLYSKTSPNGDRKFKTSDWDIVKKIRRIVQALPDLELPPIDAYIIIETDDSMEGWGGICKWKKSKFDSRNTERVCAYASEKFPTVKATIDAKIYACMEALIAMKIHYRDKKEIILRTDSRDVKELVLEITKQPKLIKEQAVLLLKELQKQIKQIQEVVRDIKKQFVCASQLPLLQKNILKHLRILKSSAILLLVLSLQKTSESKISIDRIIRS
ncbi:hypothetical protein ZIOFF_032255 [Zingiber officinale]|uniref:Reverse transcriptase domain-containing protein n=1 Tax=Zingiber officinale TaxID=94328 RepID=A0A8J5GI27_ZINOF|nr:hypothetical protein ZIOFF_032255 [Zingiber officinale]